MVSSVRKELMLWIKKILWLLAVIPIFISKRFCLEFSCKPFNNHQDLLKNIDCDIVIIAVVNKYLKEIVIDVLQQHKHVIAESL